MVEKYLRDGCGCDLTDGGCSTRFTADSLESYRREVSELTLVELDMALLGQLHKQQHTHCALHKRSSPCNQSTASSGMVERECAGRPSSSFTQSPTRGSATCSRA